MVTKTSLRDSIREDRTYKSAKKALDTIRQEFNNEEILNELFSLQASRGVSALSPKKILESSLKVLLNSSTQEMAVRSRVTTIKMTALRSILQLDQVIEPLRNYILINFHSQMKAEGISGVTNQRKAIDNYLKLFIREKRDLDYIIKIADLVIEDTDAAGWGLKRIQETLDQASKDR